MWHLKWTLSFIVALFSHDVLAESPPRVGDYKQETVPADYKELAKGVGLLLGSRGSFCTAFCLKSNVVGTAAHCVEASNRPRSRSLGRLTFRLSGRKSQRSLIDGVGHNKRFNTVLGTTRVSWGKSQSRIQQHYDWAIARLRKPICRGRELLVANLPLDELFTNKNKLISIFYQPSRKRSRLRYSKCKSGTMVGNLTRQEHIVNMPFPDDFILHNCDTKPGSSGAPIILITDGKPKVVGINRGFSEEGFANDAVHIRTVLPYIELLSREIVYPSEDLIRRTQLLLQQTADYKSGIDGIYGNGTRQAILDFTLRNSLPIAFDRPLEELVPLLELHQTPAPDIERLGALESYISTIHDTTGDCTK